MTRADAIAALRRIDARLLARCPGDTEAVDLAIAALSAPAPALPPHDPAAEAELERYIAAHTTPGTTRIPDDDAAVARAAEAIPGATACCTSHDNRSRLAIDNPGCRYCRRILARAALAAARTP